MSGITNIINSSNDKAINNTENVNVKAFSSKFRGKKECWNFLAVDVGAFLPPYAYTTIYHMRDLIMGRKTVSKMSLI